MAKDEREAVRWYRLAADQGLAVAQFNLGFAFANGTGVAKDDSEAVRWFRLAAADHGLASAQYNLGCSFQNGVGVPVDHSEALRLYRLAEQQGNAAATSNLGFMYHQGIGVAKDLTEAKRLYELAASRGSIQAKANLAHADFAARPGQDKRTAVDSSSSIGGWALFGAIAGAGAASRTTNPGLGDFLFFAFLGFIVGAFAGGVIDEVRRPKS